MKLSTLITPKNNNVTAFVGAGGKTTAIFQLARQINDPVWIAPSTHMAVSQTKLADRHIILRSPKDIPDPSLPGVTVLTGEIQKDQRSKGLSLYLLNEIFDKSEQFNIPLLIEADGSRQKPLKAPAEHEPPIPPFVDTVVVVVGLQALGHPLEKSWVHRPERFAALAETEIGELISPEHITKMLRHPQGGLKNIPSHARRIVLFNQIDVPHYTGIIRKMSAQLLEHYHAVAAAHLAEEEVVIVRQKTAGIILAAGASERMGQAKQLLDWRGKPFVRVVAETAISSGLDPVIVVTGSFHPEVTNALEGLNVQIVKNPNWIEGQSTSVKLGLRTVPDHTGAAIFLLADQPQIPVSLIEQLVASQAETLAPIVAPMIDGQRGNPVLFDQSTFPDFESITGDSGGRQVFSKHRVTWVPWLDASAGLDVDTPEDYAKLLKYQD